MPEDRTELDFERTLDETEYRALIQGVIPKSQEDKWFAFEVDDWFTLCRSASGDCIFRVRLEELDQGWEIAEAWVNRDPKQYDSADDTTDALMLDRLLDGIIQKNMT
jgi:hypothetical protein